MNHGMEKKGNRKKKLMRTTKKSVKNREILVKVASHPMQPQLLEPISSFSFLALVLRPLLPV